MRSLGAALSFFARPSSTLDASPCSSVAPGVKRIARLSDDGTLRGATGSVGERVAAKATPPIGNSEANSFVSVRVSGADGAVATRGGGGAAGVGDGAGRLAGGVNTTACCVALRTGGGVNGASGWIAAGAAAATVAIPGRRSTTREAAAWFNDARTP